MEIRVDYHGNLYELTSISKDENKVILSDLNNGDSLIMSLERFIKEFYGR